jgi:uncharacterized membrane protein YadS
MLAPVVLFFSFSHAALRTAGDEQNPPRKRSILRLVPWFVVGFAMLAGARSAGVIPDAVARPLVSSASLLTIVAMAALGLGVDLRDLRRVGLRATCSVVASLVFLGSISCLMIYLVGLV